MSAKPRTWEEWQNRTGGRALVAEKNRDTFEMLRNGQFFMALYDTETTDLPQRFAEITQFGGAVTDIACNVLHTVDLRGRVTDHAVFSPYAWVLQRMRREDLGKGDPQYVLAGKIMQFFRQSSNLHEAPWAKKFLRGHCRRNGDGTWAYPLMNGDGTLDWDSVRIHENLRRYTFRDPYSGGRAVTRDMGALAAGYNNVAADDHWLWTLFHMSCAENIFQTHLPQLGKQRTDILRAVECAVMADTRDENSIRPGWTTDPDTGERVMSFRQGAILEANTRLASEARGIAQGITLPDGSHPDLTQLHGALPDVLALAGIVRYMAKHNPGTLAAMKRNSNWKSLTNVRLTENPGGFGDHPLMAYVDKSWPRLSGHIVTMIGNDQFRHRPKTVLLFNLDVDPRNYRGRDLTRLSPAEHAQLVKECRTDAGGPYKIVHTHKAARILPGETGFSAGFNKGRTEAELVRRAKIVRDRDFVAKAMEGMRMAYPQRGLPDSVTLPQPEEELFSSFPQVEVFDPETGQSAQIHRPRNALEKRLQDARNRIISMKRLWMRALEPDEDILLGDYGANPKGRDEAARRFYRKMEDTGKMLAKWGAPGLPPSDDGCGREDPVQAAWHYKIRLLHAAREHFVEGRLQDIGQHYEFTDRHGNAVPEEEVKSWPQHVVDEKFRCGDLGIAFESLYTTPQIIDRILDQLGCAHILGPEIQEQIEAGKRLRIHGIPQLGHDRQRWMTAEAARQEGEKIRNNNLTREDRRALDAARPGAWELFMDMHPDAQACLAQWEEYIAEKLQTPFIDRDKRLVGINPLTGHERQNVVHEVPREKIVKLRVPDRYLENPATDPVTRQPVWLVPLTHRFNRSAAARIAGAEIVLEGEHTARAFHLAGAKRVPVPPQGGVNADFYAHARARFAASACTLPDTPGQLLALTGEGPWPLHDYRPVNANAQTLHVSRAQFEGLLSHRLASHPVPVSGLVFRDDHLHGLEKGPVRLLETDDGGVPTGWEVRGEIGAARRMTYKQLSTLSNDRAQALGHPTAEALKDKVARMFADKQIDPANPRRRVWVVELRGPVRPRNAFGGTSYYNPRENRLSAACPPLKAGGRGRR